MKKEISNRLQQQIKFIREIDKLKLIKRRAFVSDQSRNENSAEHSWHIAIMAIILAEYANPEVNIDRVIKMLLIHDLVEIDAGDTFLYAQEPSQSQTKLDQEQQAATRIYGILPEQSQSELMLLWQEFEERKTPDAKFAASLDRLQPILQNYFTAGGSWKKHNVSSQQVLLKNQLIEEGSNALWQLVEGLIQDAVNCEYLKSG